jgi:hypothetical protein
MRALKKVWENSFAFILHTIYIHLRYFPNPEEWKWIKNRENEIKEMSLLLNIPQRMSGSEDNPTQTCRFILSLQMKRICISPWGSFLLKKNIYNFPFYGGEKKSSETSLPKLYALSIFESFRIQCTVTSCCTSNSFYWPDRYAYWIQNKKKTGAKKYNKSCKEEKNEGTGTQKREKIIHI